MEKEAILATRVCRLETPSITALMRSKHDYFATHLDGLITNFFNNSSAQFASFFTQTSNLTKAELEDLQKIIADQIKQKKS